MSKQLKSATLNFCFIASLNLYNFFQLIILAAIFYRALRLSIAFQFAKCDKFLNDELRQIFQVFSGTLFTNSNLLQYHYYCNKKYGSTPLLRIAYLRSLIKSSFITAFIAETTRHIEISCLGTHLYCDIIYLSIESNFEEI
ncbi:hypothetical protein T06_15213 [Trichinella sp. T6]|nr:hypothetical protein T06_15213 [Trichinella sp. T6]